MTVVEHRFGALRRPVRARDADAGARRSSRPRGSRRARTRTTAPSSPALRTRLLRPPDAALPRRAPVRGRRPPRLAQARGPDAHRLAQAQQRARPVRCWPSAWASRASSPRPAPASTASRPRPRARCSGSSASSTWAPRTCAASGPTCSGCELLGATVSGVDAGSRTLKEAVSAAIRDWVANVGDTHYAIGSCVGPAPFPALVRDLQRVIGDEARAQVLERCGRLPSRVIACVGGGSNAIGTFIPFAGDPGVELIGVEAAGDGLDQRAPRRAADRRRLGGRGGVLHGSYSAIMQDEDGQITEAHSISAGLDYPGVGPEHACAARQRPRALRGGDRRAGARGVPAARRAGGDHPCARVLPRRRLGARERRGGGRARAHLPLGPRRQGPRRGAGAPRRDASPPGRTRSPPRSRAVGQARAALMPYLMGGFPDLATSRAIGEAYAESGADLVELGVPFSDPLADGPVIHAAGTAGARGRRHACTACSRSGGRSPTPSRSCSCATRTSCSRAVSSASPTTLAERGDQRPDRARPAARGGGRGAGRLRRGRRRARRAGRADDAGGRGSPRSGAARAASSTPSR